MRINTNLPSLQAQRRLSQTSQAFSRTLERLASGKRINRAADDASGLAISEGLNTQIRSLTRASRNINDAQAILNTSDGTIGTLSDILQRMGELAIQASNGTYSDHERQLMDDEVHSLLEEYNRIVGSAEFNGKKLFGGEFNDLSLQVGSNAKDKIIFNLPNLDMTSTFTTNSQNGSGGGDNEETTVGTGVFSFGSTETVNNYSSSTPGVGDFNEDGLDDLVITYDNSSGGVSIRLNNGDGSFTSMPSLAASNDVPDSPTVMDIDKDGHLDIAFVVNDGATGQDAFYIYTGNGDGTFNFSQTINTTAFPVGPPTFGDFNEDGKLDLLTTTFSNSKVELHLGNGDGTFTFDQTLSVGTLPRAPANIVDLNNDGHLDFFTVSQGSAGVSIYLGDGAGNFAVGETFSTGSFSRSGGAIGDLNGDGYQDIVIANASSNTITVAINDGDGTFTRSNLSVGTNPNSRPVLVDINNDNNLDIIVTNLSTNNISVYLGNGSGGFTAGATISPTGASNLGSSVTATDFNGDGNIDFMVAAQSSNSLYYFEGDGTGSFTEAQSFSGLGTPASSPALIDLNGDNVLDAVVTNSSNNKLTVLLQGSETTSSGGDNSNDNSSLSVSVATQADASELIEILKNARSKLAAARAIIGANQSRLQSALGATLITTESLTEARSQILDADLASETAELLKEKISQQAAVSVLSQANVNLQIVLQLL